VVSGYDPHTLYVMTDLGLCVFCNTQKEAVFMYPPSYMVFISLFLSLSASDFTKGTWINSCWFKWNTFSQEPITIYAFRLTELNIIVYVYFFVPISSTAHWHILCHGKNKILIGICLIIPQHLIWFILLTNVTKAS
jgi:hypothetical protein